MARSKNKQIRSSVSIVTTMYRSAPYLKEFYSRSKATLDRITTDYEFIFVNDGSPDESLEVALELRRHDSRIKVMDLSRNFGHHKAMLAGLGVAQKEYVFLIDCDLEEEPELLEVFWEEMIPSVDVVYGVQQKRKGRLFERWSGVLFYWLLNLLSDAKIPVNFLTVRLMRQGYVNALRNFSERSLNFSTLTVLCGFNQKELKIHKKDKGESSYSIYHKLKILVEAITSSSAKPLWMIFYAGVFIVIGVSLYIVYVMYQYFIYNTIPSGWSSIVVSIWLFGGLQILALGVISVYMSRIFEEVKQRPRIIVKELYE